jgi:hypothetical protein
MLNNCERCKRQVPKADICNYCKKIICETCKKSARRASKIKKLFICKDCWGNLAFRKRFKSNRA